MTFKEKVGDLFAIGGGYYLAHCISADFGMSAGIVVQFNKRFGMKNKLQSKYPNYLNQWLDNDTLGDCILEGKTFNLITKERVYQKPTYESLRVALETMKAICLDKNITKIAMPLIGCGIDQLEWVKVKQIIIEVFEDTDFDILVCKL